MCDSPQTPGCWVYVRSLRFQIDLGCDAEDLALHFNPRFHDDEDGAVLVCNSKTAGCWGDEKRETENPLQKGSEVKVRACDRGSGRSFLTLI